jgi:electron transport complex protein RnfC
MPKTFRLGGVHPPEEKLSANEPMTYADIPEQLMIPVRQHIGKPCEIVVERKADVKRGDVIAKSTGFVSSNVHSPVAGKVQKITRFPQLGGQISDCVIIKTEQPGESLKTIMDNDQPVDVDIDKISAREIRKRIDDAGIIGMGGAGFPTHVKLSPPPEKEIDTLIINGAECEPYITADHRVMLEKSNEVLKGAALLQKVFGGIPVLIGIEQNKPDAIAKLEKECENFKNISVIPLKVKYPQGGEKQLIKALLGREVPSKMLPMDVGTVVQNISTALAIHDAVYLNRPLTERVMTVSGNLVKKPGNIVAPIGIPISEIFQKFDVDIEQVKMVISGGPMMGRTSYSFGSPVTKTTSALLLFDEKAVVESEEHPCIRCGSCISVCPMGLATATLTEMIIANKIETSAKDEIMDCIECGSCAYICPASRRLVHWMRLGKSIIKREN